MNPFNLVFGYEDRGSNQPHRNGHTESKCVEKAWQAREKCSQKNGFEINLP